MFENKKNVFINAAEASRRQEQTRASRKISDLIKYPVSFLEDCLTGILPNELTVIGADTGCGKSYLANDIALQTALSGKKVYIFSLEGDKDEFISRIKWNFICRKHYAYGGNLNNISYHKYLLNEESTIADAEEQASSLLDKAADNLSIFSRETMLDSNILMEHLANIKDAKLIVIDHLHYLPFAGQDPEHMQISETMRLIQTITKIKGIPIVMISHLRKKSKERVLPDNDDFHGSSNIAKEADTCITISPDYNSFNYNLLGTYFRVTKSRTGADMRYIGRMYFDNQKKAYVREYDLVTVQKKEIVPLDPFKFPGWAKNAKIGGVS